MNHEKQGPSATYRDVTEPGWREAEAERDRKMAEVFAKVPLVRDCAALTAPAAEVPEAMGDALKGPKLWWLCEANDLSSGAVWTRQPDADDVAWVSKETKRSHIAMRLVPEQSTRLRGGVPDVDAICYLATEIRFAKTDDAAQAVIDKIRAMLQAAPQAPAAALDAGVVREPHASEWRLCVRVAKQAANTGMVPVKASAILAIDAAMSAQAGKGGAE